MLMVEFAVEPLGRGESLAGLVARAVDVIDRSGLKYELGPMGTSIEGEWDQVMKVVHDCIDAVKGDSHRVLFSVRGDWRADANTHLEDNVARVEKELNRPINH